MGRIYVYSSNEADNDYSTFGLVGTLFPTECTFEETTNGDSTIQMQHPLDEYGKYRALERENILQIPVPVRTTPEIQNGSVVTTVWTYTVKNLDLLTNKSQRTLYKNKTGSGTMRILNAGEKVTVVQKPIDDGNSGNTPVRWKVKCDYGTGWMLPDGLEDEVEHIIEDNANSIEEVQSPWKIMPQLFRIYEVKKSLDSISVSARHISYDLMYNITKYSTEESVSLTDALDGVLGNCDYPDHGFSAYTNVANEQPGLDYRDINPINAILDPENGIVKKFDVGLVRDNYSLYLLHDPGINRGVVIAYGRNMTGIDCTVSDDEAVTRIVPTGETKDGKKLYLDASVSTISSTLSYGSRGSDVRSMQSLLIRAGYSVGKTGVDGIFGVNTQAGLRAFQSAHGLTVDGICTPAVYSAIQAATGIVATDRYIDSPNINNYPIPHVYVMACENCTVGSKDEGGGTVTEAIARARMRAQALKMYEEKCDDPKVSVSVQYQNLGDTEEYRQFEALEKCFLFDYILVRHPKLSVDLTARITKISWDCIMERMKSTEVGEVGQTLANTGISTWQVPSGFSGSKIAGGTVDGMRLGDDIISSRHIQTNTINAQHLVADSVAAFTINAVTARIDELIAQHMTTDELYVGLATIAVGEITTANIDAANIDWASIQELTAAVAEIATAQITTANIIEANIQWADILSLNSQIASIADAEIQNASITTAQISDLRAEIATVITLAAQDGKFEFANIQDLLAQAMIIEEGVAGTVYIRNLIATNANIVGAVIGDLVLMGDDDKYYAVSVQADGTIYTEEVTVSEEEIEAGQMHDGRQIVATTANIESLNAQDLKAESAIISDIFTQCLVAGKISASEAFLASATVPELYTAAITAVGDTLDLTANKSIRLIVEQITDIGGTNLIRIMPQYVTVHSGEVITNGDDEPWRRSRHEFRMGSASGDNYIHFSSPIAVRGSQTAKETYTLSFWTWTTDAGSNFYVDDDLTLFAVTGGDGDSYSLVDGDIVQTLPDDWTGPDYEIEDDEMIVTSEKSMSAYLYDPNDTPHLIGEASIIAGEKVYNEFTFEVDYSSDVELRFVTNSDFNANERIIVSDVKLERGHVATGWSANPYDIYGKIDAEVAILEGQISAKVSNDTFNAFVNLVPTEIQAAVGELTVGGANMLRLADNAVIIRQVITLADCGEIIQQEEASYYNQSLKLFRIDPGTYSTHYGYIRFSSQAPLEASKKYTLSFWTWSEVALESPRFVVQVVKRVGNSDVVLIPTPNAGPYHNSIAEVLTINTSPTYHSYTFYIGESVGIDIRFNITSAGQNAGEYLYFSDVKLERGEKATSWTPHPEELRSGSSVSITKDEVKIQTPLFNVQIAGSGTEESFVLDKDGGVMGTLNVTQKLGAPNLAEKYDGGASATVGTGGTYPNLRALADKINSRTLTEDLTITILSDLVEDAVIGGVGGIGNLTIVGNGGNVVRTLTGSLSLKNNACQIRIQNFKMAGPVSVYGGYTEFSGCSFLGSDENTSGSKALEVSYGARAKVSSCEFYHAEHLIDVSLNADINSYNSSGGYTTDYLYINGGTARLSGTIPTGNFAYGPDGYFLFPSDPSSLTVDSGVAPAPPSLPTTVDLPLRSTVPSGTYFQRNGGWDSWGDTQYDIRQGGLNYNGYCELAGVMWFDLSQLSGIDQLRVQSAELTLARVQGSGKAADVDVYIYTTPATGKTDNNQIVNPLTNSVSYGKVGVIANNGQPTTFSLPIAVVQALMAGTAGGLMVYVNDGSYRSGVTLSENYCRYEHTGVNAPVLTVTYI